MKKQESTYIFDQERASSYDQQREKLAPIRDALHLLIRMVLSGLPTDARILCVGIGTGAELIYLAKEFPQWQFTAIEPAAPMLEVCRQRAEENGIASRCVFHEGYLDSLPEIELYDAATCILVSHFILQIDDRRKFFEQIAKRLITNGCLVSADLATDMSAATYESVLDIWERTLKYSDMPTEEVDKQINSFGKKVAALPPKDTEKLIASSGFETPTLFFQSLFIHTWYARMRS